MKLCYQVATPDVAFSPDVTAYQGSIEKSFGDIAGYGYDGVELMTLDPGRLHAEEIRTLAGQLGLCIALVCSGEVYGQLGLSFTDPEAAKRADAVARVCALIDFASLLGANVNIGRVRGQYRTDVARWKSEEWAMEAFAGLSAHAAVKNVSVALEPITILQSNFINTMGEGADMVKRVGCANFGLMMDVFHMNIEEKDLCAAIRGYQEYNLHVHLSDNNRRYPGNCGLPFGRILGCFRDAGYDGVFCTEIYQLPTMEEAAKRSIEYLAPLFAQIYGRAAV